MTALCGGAPSGQKASSPIASYFVGNELENLVQAALGVSEFWAELIVLLVQQTFDWAELCATDPPPMPTFTAADIAHIISNPIAPTDLPWQKLSDLVLNAAWWYGCECTSVATPPAPPYPSVPTGAPQPNTPTAPAGVAGACSDVSNAFTVSHVTTGVENDEMVTNLFLPGNDVSGLTGSTAFVTTGRTVPPECTSITFTGDRADSAHRTQGVAVVFEWFGANKVTLGQQLVDPDSGTHFTNTHAKPAGATYYTLWAGTNDPVVNSTWTIEAVMSCSSGSGSIVQPCCPPDSSLMAAIRQILLTVQSQQDLIRSVQRYGVPFGYIQGPTHSNLSGTASFPVSRLLGMKCVINSRPTGAAEYTGQPPYISDLGWMSVLTEDGFIDEIRLTRDTQLWMSRLFPTSVTFGYALREGVTASFTELQAEP